MERMDIEVIVHADVLDKGVMCWWAEADALPGFTAADDTLAKLKKAVRAAVGDIAPGSTLAFRLAPNDDAPANNFVKDDRAPTTFTRDSDPAGQPQFTLQQFAIPA